MNSEVSKKAIIDDFKNNKITLREMAKRLGVTYWGAQNILIEEGVPIQKLTEEEIKDRKSKIAEDMF